MTLTGKIGVRMGWFGKLIVQVEVQEIRGPNPMFHVNCWRDATINQYMRALAMERHDAASSRQSEEGK